MTKSQIKYLDDLFSAIIRTRHTCQWCGTSSDLECHHINYRRYLNTRWDLRNALALCHHCHTRAHSHRIEFEEFIMAKIGVHQFFKLKQKAFEHKKIFYEDILAKLTTKP